MFYNNNIAMLQETNAIQDMANQRARHVYLFHKTRQLLEMSSMEYWKLD